MSTSVTEGVCPEHSDVNVVDSGFCSVSGGSGSEHTAVNITATRITTTENVIFALKTEEYVYENHLVMCK